MWSIMSMWPRARVAALGRLLASWPMTNRSKAVPFPGVEHRWVSEVGCELGQPVQERIGLEGGHSAGEFPVLVHGGVDLRFFVRGGYHGAGDAQVPCTVEGVVGAQGGGLYVQGDDPGWVFCERLLHGLSLRGFGAFVFG